MGFAFSSSSDLMGNVWPGIFASKAGLFLANPRATTFLRLNFCCFKSDGSERHDTFWEMRD